MSSACPSREELARIGTGPRGDTCPPDLAIHIEGCPACREFLERFVQNGLESLAGPPAVLPPSDLVPRIEGFTIERELGRGAMGVVYLAHMDTLRRQVALKLLAGGRRAGPRDRAHWLREAKAVASVRHPNVVTLHELKEVDDWFLLVLEYIPGGTLADRLSDPLAPRDAARLTETIARAVHHIHQIDLKHLDLKPSNILLDGDVGAGWDAVIPKVSDFGIAWTAEPGATATGGAVPGGTPSYMAPEQLTKARNEITARADIHGLGAILYHMLTGRAPYQGATVQETIDLVQRQDPIPPRQLNPKIPSDLETICLKCLEKDPAKRYSTAELLADDLDRWQSSRPILAQPASAAARSWRWCRRRPVVAALVAAVALAVSAGFPAVIVLWRQAEAGRARAEANFRMSNDVVTGLVDLSVAGERQLPRVMPLNSLIPRLEKVRNGLLAISTNRPDDLSVVYQLAVVERQLGEYRMQAGRNEDARTDLRASLGRLDACAKRDPSDGTIREAQRSHLHCLTDLSERLGKAEDIVDYRTRAVELDKEEVRQSPSTRAFDRLLANRRALARLHFSRGDRKQAGSVFAENRQLLENPPPAGEVLSTPLERLKADIDCKVCDGGPAVKPGPHLAGPLSKLRSLTDASQPATEWAQLAAEALRAGARKDPILAARRESEDALKVADLCDAIAAFLRRLRDMDGPQRIAERMLALGNDFVATYPGQSSAHLALSLAYFERYLNAHVINDRAAIVGNLNSALKSAQTALHLDPQSVRAQQAVSDLQRRLADLHAKR